VLVKTWFAQVAEKLSGRRDTAREAGTEREPSARAESPPRCPGNPGIAASGEIEFTSGMRRWIESFDLVRIAAEQLRERGHEVDEWGTWLELRPSGLVLQPLLVEMNRLAEGGVQTVTTIDVRHPELMKDGLFEFQHSTGDDLSSSLAKGIAGWESVDLPVLLDALRPRPEKCQIWEMTFPEKDGRPARVRRAVLGGVSYYAALPEAKPAQCEDDSCEHSFCPCCFLTRNFEAFRTQIEGDGTYGIRFFAMRQEDDELLSKLDPGSGPYSGVLRLHRRDVVSN
jgi:hypothetical protein